jgi:hypothetical protein
MQVDAVRDTSSTKTKLRHVQAVKRLTGTEERSRKVFWPSTTT